MSNNLFYRDSRDHLQRRVSSLLYCWIQVFRSAFHRLFAKSCPITNQLWYNNFLPFAPLLFIPFRTYDGFIRKHKGFLFFNSEAFGRVKKNDECQPAHRRYLTLCLTFLYIFVVGASFFFTSFRGRCRNPIEDNLCMLQKAQVNRDQICNRHLKLCCYILLPVQKARFHR